MMESLHLSTVLMALCLLIFLAIADITEKYGKKISHALEGLSWNTFFMFIFVWAGILVLRKLVYYIPIDGMIQTKTSIWWIEKKGWLFLFIFWLIVLIMVLRGMIRRSKLPWEGGTTVYLYEIVVIFSPIAIIFLGMKIGILVPGSFFSHIYSYITQLLLSLKLVCSGKYIGLFTSFLLAYYITNGQQIFNVSPGMNKNLKKEKNFGIVFLVPLFLIVMGIFTYFTIPCGPSAWLKELQNQLHDASLHQRERAFEDLLDAANYMKDGVKKSRALGEIAAVIGRTGDIQRAKKILMQAFNEIERLQDTTLKFKTFGELAFILKESGDNSGAKQIFKKAVGAVQWIKDSKQRAYALKVLIDDDKKTLDKKWEKDILLWTVDATDNIYYDSVKEEIFKAVISIISKIPDIETRDIMLSEIRQRIEKK